MNFACRSWLPNNAGAPPAALGALADMVEAWSTEWFAGDPFRTGAFSRVAEPRAELRKTMWHRRDGGLAIGLPADGEATLGALVLGVVSKGQDRPVADRALLGAVGKECLEDLKRRTAGVVKLGASPWTMAEGAHGDGAVHRIEIAHPDRRLLLILQFGEDLFVRFVKSHLPSPPIPALGVADDALVSLPVSLSAALGSCSITLAELTDLAAGDVLVLGRALDSQLPLAINNREAARGACTVADRDGAPALRIVQAPAG
jgi:flagellar motor switch/type III secretory pathway protein FliN